MQNLKISEESIYSWVDLKIIVIYQICLEMKILKSLSLLSPLDLKKFSKCLLLFCHAFIY